MIPPLLRRLNDNQERADSQNVIIHAKQLRASFPELKLTWGEAIAQAETMARKPQPFLRQTNERR